MDSATENPSPVRRRRRTRHCLPPALVLTLAPGDDVLDRYGRTLTVADTGPSGLTLVGDTARRSWVSRTPWEWAYQAAEELSLIP